MLLHVLVSIQLTLSMIIAIIDFLFMTLICLNHISEALWGMIQKIFEFISSQLFGVA